jgi:hypothetical protein
VRDGAHDETQAKEEQHEAEDGERAAAATHTPRYSELRKLTESIFCWAAKPMRKGQS